ncbi:hypothetical protein [Fonticella tunisiensis]|nr:hypothetical protein [Fonticella tunisiensis]
MADIFFDFLLEWLLSARIYAIKKPMGIGYDEFNVTEVIDRV